MQEVAIDVQHRDVLLQILVDAKEACTPPHHMRQILEGRLPLHTPCTNTKIALEVAPACRCTLGSQRCASKHQKTYRTARTLRQHRLCPPHGM